MEGASSPDGRAISPRRPTCEILFGVLVALAAAFAYFLLCPRWEYRSVKCIPEKVNERTSREAFSFSTISVDRALLDKLGNEGWELVSSSLEVETAFPNFGESEYVLGLQPNVRPQALILLFKRRVLPWRR